MVILVPGHVSVNLSGNRESAAVLQLRIFELGDYPGLSGLAQCHPRGGQSEEETFGEAEEGGMRWPALRMEEEATGQGRWAASRSWKRQGKNSPLGFSEGTGPAAT